MAKTPTRSEEESYRVMFFVIASLIMASSVWLLYQEFFQRRPWKDHQTNWFEVARTRAKKNVDGEQAWLESGAMIVKNADGEDEEIQLPARIKELEERIKATEGEIIDSPQRAEFERLRAELETAEIKVKDAEMLVAFAKANADEYYYYYRRDKHHDDLAGEEKHLAKVKAYEAEVAAKEVRYGEAVAARDAIVDKIETIRKDVAKAKRELAELRAGLEGAKRALDSVPSPGFGVFGNWEVMQHWNQEIDLVDRCHTCHMGVDKCGFSAPREILADAVSIRKDPEQIAPVLRKKYCLTREESAAYAEAAVEIQDSFGEEDELSFESPAIQEKLKLDAEPVAVAAKKLGMDQDIAEKLFRSHPDRTELFKLHPNGHYGCTTCHYGQGRQTKAVGINLLKGYQASAADFHHTKNDQGANEGGTAHYWLSQLLDLQKGHTQASCFNCHKVDYELDYAPKLTEARKLVTHLGCTGCHPLGPLDPERKHGPTLTKVGAKMDPGWLAAWIQEPKALRPRTRMPNFWPEVSRQTPAGERKLVCNKFDYARGAAVSPAETEDCAEKRTREVAYITKFLIDGSESLDLPAMPESASAEKGQEVFESVGCMGCHDLGAWEGGSSMPGSADRDFAPNLSNVGDKIKDPGWFFAWVKNPKGYWHQTRMPSLRLSDEEAWNVAKYLSEQKSGKAPAITPYEKYMAEDGAAKKGEALIAWYGCFGCHDVKGFENRSRVGVELTDFGSKLPHKLDFGDVPEFVSDHHAQTWEAWTRRKVKDPRGYRYERVETRMPQFDVTPAEVEKLVLFLKSQNNETDGWPDHIRRPVSDQLEATQRGALLVDSLNCGGCHQIDQRGIDVNGDRVVDGGDLYRWFEDHPDEKFRSPPRLMNIGKKLYPEWLFGFLKEPFKLRENYKVRMPTFQLTDADAADLVAYFAAKSEAKFPYVEKRTDVLSEAEKAEAEQLFAAAQCTNCHALDAPSPDPRAIAPNLRLAADRLQYDWLFEWFKDPQRQIPGVAMPGFFMYDEDKDDYSSPLPQFAGGDWKRQIELLRAYVISLGRDRSRTN